jgi:hypothetical protein
MSFRKIDLRPDAPYYSQWMLYADVKSRSLELFVVFFLGGLSATFLLGGLVRFFRPDSSDRAVALCIAPTVIGVIAAMIVSQGPIRWPCPRCGKRFHATSWGYNGLARRCLHCKLPLWAPGPDAGG